jgi:hypothetical protein
VRERDYGKRKDPDPKENLIMKNEMCIALIYLAMIPAYAQKTAAQDRPANNPPAASDLRDYADQINGLLRDVHASLQQISERAAAGEITPEQERKLKLASTRAMIARLETISAVYDAKVADPKTSKDGNAARHTDRNPTDRETADRNAGDRNTNYKGFVAGDKSAEEASARAALHTNNSVSVEDLKQESAR